jgi:hypothetical protein
MLIPVAGVLELLVAFCMLFPDMASDKNSNQATIQYVNLSIPSFVRAALGPCDGNSSTKRAAIVLASDCDHRSQFNFHILAARLLIASALGSWVRRAASCQGSTS